MADIDGGRLSFVSEMDNSQIDSALQETLRRVQGFSDGIVGAGDSIDKMVADAKNMLSQVDAACDANQASIEQLKEEYKQLEIAERKALLAGATDQSKEVKTNRERRVAIQGEITAKKKLVEQLQKQGVALDSAIEKLLKEKKATEDNAKSKVSLRTRIRELQMELVSMERAGERNTARYKEVQNEVAGLVDAMGDARQQANILANDDAGFAGVMSGLTGLTGGFSAVAGMVGLFGNESENLQQIMLKTQSIMAVTNGLMQVSQALNKDSAFMLGTVGRLKEWYNGLLAQEVARQAEAAAATEGETIAENENTAATEQNSAAQQRNAAARTQDTATANANTASERANTASKNANSTANTVQATTAKAGTVANIGLAGAFRMVGAAIKSIPVFGWIIAGISALISAYSYFSSKAAEAKKAQEEFSKSMVENCYKPIGTIKDLSARWVELGDNLEAKKKFIEENRQKFDELDVSINGVTDAENLLVANKGAFIEAQIEKAKAMVYVQMAMDKQKEAMLKLTERDRENQTVVKLGFKGWYSPWQEKNEEYKALLAESENLFAQARSHEQAGFQQLQDASIESTAQYAEGSLGAIEQAIQLKQAALKNLTDNTAYKEALTELAELQDQANKITGNKTNQFRVSGDGGGGTKTDPFLEKLQKRKAEYQRFLKWVNSGDSVLIASANQEFAGLLEQGATYIDYLRKQRDQILAVDVAARTKEQNKQLRTLNDQIAEETKRTVLEQFNQELSEQLTNAKSVIEMLNIIERRRQELAKDGTEIDNGKSDILDDAEKDARKQAKEQTEALLEEFASYTDKRRAIEEQFNKDMELLNRARAAATTDADRASVDAAIANRRRQYTKDTDGTGNTDYDALLVEYGTFEQRKQAIIDEYEKKREIAREMGDQNMLESLNKAQAKALSSLASDELTNSDIWGQLFNNLDEMTASEIEKLVTEIEQNFANLSISFNPSDLANIREQLENAKNVLIKDNPFKQLGIALKGIFKNASSDSEDSANDIKKDWHKLADSTEKCFQFVSDAVEQCEPLKEVIGEVGTTALSSLSSVVMTSIAVSEAVKTAEKSSVILAIIQAALMAVQAISSLFMLGDKAAEKRIQKHEEAVKSLQNAYKQLEWQINKALGEDIYKNQQAAIRNMQQQQAHLYAMIDEERGKKKTDSDKISDYQEQINELDRSIQDMLDEISEDILQTNAKDFANDLAENLVNAFEKGEDAAKAFEETVNEVLKNAIVNQLKKKFLEQQLQGALDNLTDSMGYWNGDDFVFDGLTDSELEAFRAKVQDATDNFNQALSIYSDLFKDLANENDADTSLTGAVKGVSEETASLVAGQMNAVRINQLEIKDILRQQLLVLNTIAANTAFNKHLAKIDRIITILESNGGDSLRSQGLVG